jgi:putative transposase
MPRQARLDIPGLVHHVMARGIDGCDIFHNDADRELFLNRMTDILADHGAPTLYAWTLMPNHFHILIRPSETHLCTIMQRLMTGYAVNFNKKYNRKGHLFQNRYKSIVVEEDSYFLELIRYIHLNPVRAGIVASAMELATYRYTGHSVILGERMCPTQNIGDVLRMFSQEKSIAISRYQDYVADGIGQGTRKDLQGGGLIRSAGGIASFLARNSREHEAADERILGGGEFVEMVLQAHGEEHKTHLSNIEGLLSVVALRNGLNDNQILGPSRNRDVSKARREFYLRAYDEIGASLTLLGRMTGRAHVSVARCIE